MKNGDGAPDNEKHDHHGRYDHDLQRLLARFVNSLNVLPPEIKHHQNREERGKVVFRKDKCMMNISADILDETRQILACRDRAYRSCKYVIEQQRRNGELGQGPTHGLFHYTVNAAAHEHAAGLNVKSPYGIAKKH